MQRVKSGDTLLTSLRKPHNNTFLLTQLIANVMRGVIHSRQTIGRTAIPTK